MSQSLRASRLHPFRSAGGSLAGPKRTTSIGSALLLMLLSPGALEAATLPFPEVAPDDFVIGTMECVNSSFGVSCGLREAAAAYNPDRQEYLVVWVGVDDGICDDPTSPSCNAGNHVQVWGQLVDATSGAEIGLDDFRISDMQGTGEITSTDVANVAVAYNPLREEYLVLWAAERSFVGMLPGQKEVWGQRLDAAGDEIGVSNFPISFPVLPPTEEGLIAATPALAYNALRDEFVVVWSYNPGGDREIYAQRIVYTVDGALLGDGSEPLQVSEMGGPPPSSPLLNAVSPDLVWNPARDEYVVAWKGDDEQNGQQAIFVQRLRNDANTNRLALVNGPVEISDGAVSSSSGPAIAHDPGRDRYLVVWSGFAAGETEVLAQAVRYDAHRFLAEIGADDLRLTGFGPIGDTDFDAVEPDLVYLPAEDQYIVGWTGRRTDGSSLDRIFLQGLNGDGSLPPELDDLQISASNSRRPALVAAASIGEALVVWDEADFRTLFGQRLRLSLVEPLLIDGFESGDTTAWSPTTP